MGILGRREFFAVPIEKVRNSCGPCWPARDPMKNKLAQQYGVSLMKQP